MLRLRIGIAAEQSLARLGFAAVGQDHGDRARAEGKGRQVFAHGPHVGRVVDQALDGLELPIADAFGRYDERGVDLAQLDHVGDDGHTVQKAETGVAQVKVARRRRQTEVAVDNDGRRRFEIVAAHGGVDQKLDLAAIDARVGERFFSGPRRRIGKHDPLVEPAPFYDLCQLLDTPPGDPELFVDRRQLFLDPGGGDHVIGDKVAQPFNADVFVSHLLPLV